MLRPTLCAIALIGCANALSVPTPTLRPSTAAFRPREVRQDGCALRGGGLPNDLKLDKDVALKTASAIWTMFGILCMRDLPGGIKAPIIDFQGKTHSTLSSCMFGDKTPESPSLLKTQTWVGLGLLNAAILNYLIADQGTAALQTSTLKSNVIMFGINWYYNFRHAMPLACGAKIITPIAIATSALALL